MNVFPTPTEGVDLCRAAAVAQGTDGLKVGVDGAPLALVAMRIGFESLDELVLVGLDERYRALSLGVARLLHFPLVKVALGSVSGDAKPTGGLTHGDVALQHHAPSLTEGSHVDHSCLPCSKNQQGMWITWRILGWNQQVLFSTLFVQNNCPAALAAANCAACGPGAFRAAK